MDREKGFPQDSQDLDEPSSGSTSPQAPRARNRTVMLTPDITGQVRARLAQEKEQFGTPQQGLPQPGGFEPPRGGGMRSLGAGTEVGGFEPPSSAGYTTPGATSSGVIAVPPPPGRAAPQQSYAPPSFGGGSQRVSLAVWTKTTPVIGFLVSYDKDANGEIYELRSGRLVVTSEPAASGSYFLVEDETVSPMHAIMRVSTSGEVQVLDQLSEYGTKIVRAESGEVVELSGDKGFLHQGDVVHFGRRKFCVTLIMNPPKPMDDDF